MTLLTDTTAVLPSRTDAEPSALVVHPSSQGAFSSKMNIPFVRGLVDSGHTRHQIAEMFGISFQRVSYFCLRHGIDYPAPKPVFCLICQREIPYERKTGPTRYAGFKYCSAPACRSKIMAFQYGRSAKRSHSPAERKMTLDDSTAFVGHTFTDDPRAVASEPRFMRHPEPSRSGCGCAAEMCAR
jgi:hypothetical protein